MKKWLGQLATQTIAWVLSLRTTTVLTAQQKRFMCTSLMKNIKKTFSLCYLTKLIIFIASLTTLLNETGFFFTMITWAMKNAVWLSAAGLVLLRLQQFNPPLLLYHYCHHSEKGKSNLVLLQRVLASRTLENHLVKQPYF